MALFYAPVRRARARVRSDLAHVFFFLTRVRADRRRELPGVHLTSATGVVGITDWIGLEVGFVGRIQPGVIALYPVAYLVTPDNPIGRQE